MLTLRDIMTREVVTLDPEMTLRDALEILASRHISGAPVVEGERVVGIFSSMDAIEFLATTPGVPDVVDTQEDDEPARDEASRDAHMPPEYFVDFWSNAGADVADRFRDVNAAAWDLLAEHTVSEAMNRSPVVFAASAAVRTAAAAMERAHAHRVLVMDGTRLVGIVSALDVARAVAKRQLVSTKRTQPRRG
jgi:CBS domain-containing protein